MPYRDYQKALAPGWLRDEWGEAFLGAFGALKDWLASVAKEAVKARMPRLGPPDAIAELGRERGIERGAAEAEASYRERVRAAWDTWRWAGTPYGVLLAFFWAGYRPASGKVVLQAQAGKQYELRTDFDPALHAPEEALVVTNITIGDLGGPGGTTFWSKFAVLFVNPLPPAWIPTPPADGSNEVNAIRRLISRWKPGHALCVKLAVVGGRLWGYPPDDLWNSYPAQTWAQVGSGVNATWTPPSG